MNSQSNNKATPPKKVLSKPLDKLTKYELIVLAQKQDRALKRASKQIQQLTGELNSTILDCDRDYNRISTDLEQVKQQCKAFEIDQLKQRNVLLSLLAHAQMELQLAQAKNAILHLKYGVTPSLAEEVKTLRVGQSTVTMGFFYHEMTRN